MKEPFSVRATILAGGLLLQLGTLGFQSHGAPGDVDLSFDPGSGINGQLNAGAVQPDGKAIISGAFTAVKGLARPGIARLNLDGSGNAAFNPGTGANGSVYAVVLQPDGKVLIGGDFTSVNGSNRFGIARLNANGSVDTSFSPGTGPGVWVHWIALQSDGKLFFAGGFPILEGRNRIGMARLNANGSLDSSFDSGASVPLGDNQSIISVAAQSDGKVLVAGTFTVVNGTSTIRGIVRLNANGSLDGSFNPGTGVYPTGVSAVVVQPDGKVLIGGSFTGVNGTNRNRIARLNANGSLDGNFNPGTGVGGADPLVNSIAVQANGKVLVGGGFTAVNGTSRTNIARLNANGSLDSTFNPGTGANGVVRSVALQPDGNVLIGGNFTLVNGVARPYVARLHGDPIVGPSLKIARSNAVVKISWPVAGLNFQLQQSTNLTLLTAWSAVAQAAVTNAGQVSVTVPMAAGRKFFRLKMQ